MDYLKRNNSNDGKVLLNLGCGQTRPHGWINLDCSLNSLLQNIGIVRWILEKSSKRVIYRNGNAGYVNLNKRWPFPDGNVDLVYVSHVFEHLSLSSAALFLSESYRVLKPCGVIRIVVPDLYKLAKNYVRAYENQEIEASTVFLYWANLHQESTYRSERSLSRKLIDAFQNYPHQHKYMYDDMSLRRELTSAGFTDLIDCSYGNSQYITEISQVEDTAEGVVSIYIEGKKPRIVEE